MPSAPLDSNAAASNPLAEDSDALQARPGFTVELAKKLRDQADEVMLQAVNYERSQGTSWEQIGEKLGVSRSAAQQRFGREVGRLSEKQDSLRLLPLRELHQAWRHVGRITADYSYLKVTSPVVEGEAGSGANAGFTYRDCDAAGDDVGFWGRSPSTNLTSRHVLGGNTQGDEPYLVVTGPPGSGKSDLVAHVISSLDPADVSTMVTSATNRTVEERISTLEEKVAQLLERQVERDE
ncbi:hypothetical protein [Streptomyces sp. SYP-A7185]|uniref:hypothetical protein n=1 Tax=Streptomyces sp. SYP-A7185 TaxID=3040076 RepID=UPI0038F71F92